MEGLVSDMKYINMEDLSEKQKESDMYDGYSGVDWKESPDELLEVMDLLLSEHGLEIEQLNDGSDMYHFRIIKRKKKIRIRK